MVTKEFCNGCLFEEPKHNRSIIAKIGHIKREIKTNNRLSDKSIERLRIILLDGPDDGHKDFYMSIIKSIEENRNFDKLDEDQLFWVYESMELVTKWKMYDFDPDTF